MNVRNLLAKVSLFSIFVLAGSAYADGDVAAGKSAAAPCAACHGQDGATGLDPSYPNLAGQNEKYMLNQLRLIQDGTRNILLMSGQLNGKSEQELANLSAYYASLPAKQSAASGSDEAIAAGEGIYRAGIARKGVAACTACHNPSGSGNMQSGFPRINGQPAAYTINQLTAYRERARSTDEVFGGMMRGVAEGLTDTEIALVADYIEGLN